MKIFDMCHMIMYIFSVLWYVVCDMCVYEVNDLKKVSAFRM
jgi:hypothetical protein